MVMSSKLVGNIMRIVNEAMQNAPKKTGSTTVEFDTKTDRPWKAKFSQRGFSVEGTRLSFELIEDAISKEYTITLGNGQGLVLDGVKMQKLLKYKTLY
jgi:hypothetical protein